MTASTVAEAVVAADTAGFAVLDVDLGGGTPRAAAEEMRRREVPFAHVTGCSERHSAA